MSIFEWLGERNSPGPVGGVDHGDAEPSHWHPSVIVARGAVAVALLVGAIWWTVTASDSGENVAQILMVLAGYLAIAYWLMPRPNYENVGWAGGLIDHPFQWSDDVNRMLVAVKVVLWPGRFVTVGIRDLFRLTRGRRVLVLPPRDR